MATKRANTSIVNLADGRQVLYSYGVAVAALLPAEHAPEVRHTACKHCGLDIEGINWSDWRDRGNDTRCMGESLADHSDLTRKHEPVDSQADHESPARYVALDHSFSVTTSKHVNQFTGRRATRVSPVRFAELISPLAPNYPAGVM